MSLSSPLGLDPANFVWFGMPKLTEGGMDTRAPLTIWQNFQTFREQATLNPLHFWCQAPYINQYREYFAKKGVQIAVHGIEEYLIELASERSKADGDTKSMARSVLDLLQKFLGEGRNRVDERVNAKDLFFYFLMATTGGYVLDTTCIASAVNPVKLEHYRGHRFMWAPEAGVPEISLQFSPVENLSRARSVLAFYIKKMQEAEHEFARTQDVTEYYLASRYISIEAIALDDSLRKEIKEDPDLHSFESERAKRYEEFKEFVFESCQDEISPFQLKLTRLQVIKEFNNSHKPQRGKRLPMPYFHALYGDYRKLVFDVEHGVDPNQRLSMEFSRAEINEFGASRVEDLTLLHACLWLLEFREVPSDPDFCPNISESVRFLLEHGADPELPCRIYEIDAKDEEPRIETPLSECILQKCPSMLMLLLKYCKTSVSEITVETTPILWFAIINEFTEGVDVLLRYGADPNVTLNEIEEDPYLETSENPFHYAIRIQDAKLLRTLFRSGVKPADLTSIYTDENGRTIKLTYDQLLEKSSEECNRIFNQYMKQSAALATPKGIFEKLPEGNVMRHESLKRHREESTPSPPPRCE